MVKKRVVRAEFLVFALVVLLAGVCSAMPVYVETNGADFGDLLGGAAVAVDPAMISDFSVGNLSSEIISQAFADGAGSYLYLYQIVNTGSINNEVITRFTASPYGLVNSSFTLGFLNGNIPAAFTLGDQAPLYGDIDSEAGPTVGFNYPVGNPIYGIPDSYVAPGQSSMVMYVLSDLAPGLVMGHVINGGVHSNVVVGPVPEPATVCLLALGGIGLLRKRSR